MATPYRALDLAAMTERVGRADHPILKGWEKLSPKDRAEREFMFGMGKALEAMRNASAPDVPLAVYYAYKQSEATKEEKKSRKRGREKSHIGEIGLTSPGWASFLQAVVDSGLMVDGTWPVRTESPGRIIGKDANALASSVVLVCRPRPTAARAITRRDFVAELRRELPEALAKMKQAGLHPVDIPQAALGPGMAVFSRYSMVREPDDSAMSVAKAIALINQVRGEIDHVESGDLDAATRFALDWFASYGWEKKGSGQAIQLAQSYDLVLSELTGGDGLLITTGGDARLRQRTELREDWRPSTDRTLTAWELAQAMNRALNEGGGVVAAAGLLAEARQLEFHVSWLCSRLFGMAEDRKLSEEARSWGRLSEAWDQIEAKASELARGGPAQSGAQPDLYEADRT